MDPTEPLKTMATKMMCVRWDSLGGVEVVRLLPRLDAFRPHLCRFVPSLTWNLLCNQIKPLNRNWCAVGAVLYCAVLGRAPCDAVPCCRAMPCRAVLCDAVP